MLTTLRQEKFLWLAMSAGIAMLLLSHFFAETGQSVSLLLALIIIAVIVGAALRVAHHAEQLAERFGEPYGTMILTISAVLVEVLVLAILLTHDQAPTLVRDTIYSALMLDINGVLGIAALIGGLKHGEQKYNCDSGNSYVVMILIAVAIAMVVPEFVPPANERAYSIFTILIMLVLYGLFLRLQTGQHSYFFSYAYKRKIPAQSHDAEPTPAIPVARHVTYLVVGLAIIGWLSEIMSPYLTRGLDGSGLPAIVPGLLVAFISASPEILTALRSALANRIQSTLNIALGASLSTVLLTVPVIEAIGLFTHHTITIAMTPVQTLMVFVTLIAATINLTDGSTNAIEGKAHFALFLTFVMLSAIGL